MDTLGRLYLRHEDSRTSLARLRLQLNGISTLTPARRGVPEPHWTRLNDRYRPAVALARLIISTAGLEARAGGIDASVFLIDMNAVFERFIRVALREALRLDIRTFPPAARGHHPVQLDKDGTIRLEPDLSWWTGDRCMFVGDCKYKKTDDTIPNADAYQMLAYLTALQLTRGLLVYAAGEDVPHDIYYPARWQAHPDTDHRHLSSAERRTDPDRRPRQPDPIHYRQALYPGHYRQVLSCDRPSPAVSKHLGPWPGRT